MVQGGILKYLKEGAKQILFGLERRFKSFYMLEEDATVAILATLSHPKFKNYWVVNFSVLESVQLEKKKSLEELLLTHVTDINLPNKATVYDTQDILMNSEPEEDDLLGYKQPNSHTVSDYDKEMIRLSSEVKNFLSDPVCDMVILHKYLSLIHI